MRRYDPSVLVRHIHVAARTNDFGAGVIFNEGSDLGKRRIEDHRSQNAEQIGAAAGATSDLKGVVR
jgi:hypothetical protein